MREHKSGPRARRPWQRTTRFTVAAVAVLFLIAISGVALAKASLSTAPELAAVKETLELQSLDSHFEEVISLRLGRTALGGIKMLLGLAGEDQETRQYLEGTESLDVAIYEVSEPTGLPERDITILLAQTLEAQRWKTAVKVRDGKDLVCVSYRAEEESMTGVHIVVLDSENLVLVQAQGHLEHLLAMALQNHSITEELIGDLGIR